MSEQKIVGVRVYLKNDNILFPATEVQINRMTDEIDILEGVNLIAKFFSRNIAGYAILREAVTNNDIGRD